MPSSFKAGMATSARQVVGLQEPPKKTSTGAEELEEDEEDADADADDLCLQSSTLLKDFVLRNSFTGKLLQFVAVVVVVEDVISLLSFSV